MSPSSLPHAHPPPHPAHRPQYNACEFLRKEILRKSEKIVSLENVFDQREAQVAAEHEALVRAATARDDAATEEARRKEAAAKRQVAAFDPKP